ncbi:hypothetical protein [Alteromonas ponticola]|uniref:Uncharacterized protein n=1 Tax=Alteromonas ponticola TaxID=2720613 RepID=A0ABX1QZK1_9ALTE|nr:hypothetical protein [Alteromonas ponticola]NMH59259.1 hypothetical protein [Alteromonas ponticola]
MRINNALKHFLSSCLAMACIILLYGVVGKELKVMWEMETWLELMANFLLFAVLFSAFNKIQSTFFKS